MEYKGSQRCPLVPKNSPFTNYLLAGQEDLTILWQVSRTSCDGIKARRQGEEEGNLKKGFKCPVEYLYGKK